MIRLLFVGDGERDAATNPHLVTVITGLEVNPSHKAWTDLRLAGGGNDRKLLFAIRQARDEGLEGVVAAVDHDKSSGRDRLRVLVDARNKDRETAPGLPTAVGCAIPHAEAWLLDDAVAVRTVLRLDNRAAIPNVRRIDSPKEELGKLHAQSPRADEPIRTMLTEIAQSLVPNRCQHSKETGFEAFANDIEDEIGPLRR
jgi:hypothetical protein